MINGDSFCCSCGGEMLTLKVKDLPRCYDVEAVREYYRSCLADEPKGNFIIISPNISIAAIFSSENTSDFKSRSEMNREIMKNGKKRRWIEIHISGHHPLVRENRYIPLVDGIKEN